MSLNLPQNLRCNPIERILQDVQQLYKDEENYLQLKTMSQLRLSIDENLSRTMSVWKNIQYKDDALQNQIQLFMDTSNFITIGLRVLIAQAYHVLGESEIL
jgi:hypothetical protein